MLDKINAFHIITCLIFEATLKLGKIRILKEMFLLMKKLSLRLSDLFNVACLHNSPLKIVYIP